ncbi:MAG: class I SAM-dependent methyltransferase [Clostridia bacterium]|nr:class I SAM-dependent methyltransferase [Clostridia bacterium]
MTPLSPRLNMAASMVPLGLGLADIGTDHAYLPVSLVMNGTVPYAIAADLREGPLKNAQDTIAKAGLSEKIDTVLSDGLSADVLKSYSSFSICGMGGNLMVDILSAAPWIKKDGTHLVLQPQTHAEDVRQYLFDNGFEIIREDAVEDDGRTYIAIEAGWTGRKTEYRLSDCYIGELGKCTSPARLNYFNHVLGRLNNRRNGISANPELRNEVSMLDDIIREIERCIN